MQHKQRRRAGSPRSFRVMSCHVNQSHFIRKAHSQISMGLIEAYIREICAALFPRASALDKHRLPAPSEQSWGSCILYVKHTLLMRTEALISYVCLHVSLFLVGLWPAVKLSNLRENVTKTFLLIRWMTHSSVTQRFRSKCNVPAARRQTAAVSK